MKYPNSKYMESKKNRSKSKAESAFEDFKTLLSDKTHPDNQTDAYKKNVLDILNRLLVSADELDSEAPGQGIFSLIVLSLRSSIKLKDDYVKLEYENKKLKLEVDRLKKQKL